MRKQRSYRSWFTSGFGLGPFAYQRRIEKRIRKEMPFAEFAGRIREQLIGSRQPRPQTLAHLYKFCLQTRKITETMRIAARTLKTRTWRSNAAKTSKLLSLLDEFGSFDPEQTWRKAVGSRKESRTARRAKELAENLRDLNDQIRWWRNFSESGSWQDYARDQIIAMDKYLARRVPWLNQKVQRATVMSAALEAVGLRKTESTEAILRMLQRHKKE